MNELTVKQSSAEVLKTVWINGETQTMVMKLEPGDDPKEYYYVFLRGESSYIISQSNFDRIQDAIGKGAKFVRINDDLVNVNEIKRFKKN